MNRESNHAYLPLASLETLLPIWEKEMLSQERKFWQTGDSGDLEVAIETAKRVLDSIPPDYPDRGFWCGRLGKLFAKRYENHVSADIQDLEQAITCTTEAVNLTPTDSPKRLIWLHYLGDQLNEKFKKTGDLETNALAQKSFNEALDIVGSDMDFRGILLISLAEVIISRFKITKDLSDVGNAVLYIKESLNFSKLDDICRQTCINALGRVARSTIPTPRSREDLDSFITVLETLIEFGLYWHDNTELTIRALAVRIMDRYELAHMIEDLRRLIEIAELFMGLDEPEDEKSLADREGVLIVILALIDDIIAEDGQLDPSEKDLFKAKASQLEIHLELIDPRERLENLVEWYSRIDQRIPYLQTSQAVRATNKIIELCQKGLQMTVNQDVYTKQMFFLVSIAHAYYNRYRLLRDPNDLKSATEYIDLALTVVPVDDPNREHLLSDLINVSASRFMSSRDLTDLDRAIDLIHTYSGSIKEEKLVLHLKVNLFSILVHRMGITESMSDVTEAVKIAKDYLGTAPPDNAYRYIILEQYIALQALLLSDQTEAYQDFINEMESLSKITTRPEQREFYLAGLGQAYFHRYASTGALEDLEKSIAFFTEGTEYFNKDPAMSIFSYHRLSEGLYRRFELSQDMEDLNKAIDFVENSLKYIPSYDHPRYDCLYSLGAYYRERYMWQGEKTDEEKAKYCLRAAVNGTNATHITRIRAIQALSSMLWASGEAKEAATILKSALDLISGLSPRSLNVADRQNVVKKFSGLATRATAAMLENYEAPFEVLKYLELGRGLFASLMLEMNSDIKELKEQYPDLAARFELVQQYLTSNNDIVSPSFLFGTFESAALIERTRRDYRNASRQFDEILQDIRAKPGFENFLQPLTLDQIQATANPDPIVVINVDLLRSDAIIIESHRIRSIELVGLDPPKVRKQLNILRRGNQEAWDVLEWLWESIALPVLEELDITGPPKDGKWPRIWWVPTGSLSQLPLHAAGRHFSASGETVMDRVISSYSLSIRFLIYGRQRPQHPPGDARIHCESEKALLISMPETRNQSALQHARAEIDMLERLCPSLGLEPINPPKQRAGVLAHLAACKVFHFAGHGHHDASDPSKSFLLLDDWEMSPLSVKDFWDKNLRSNLPFLAYLSACSTGATSETYSDEGLNLINACQLSGFRHVIGTLWEVKDSYCVKVAQKFYETFRGKEMTDLGVAIGLHESLRSLRDEAIKDESVREIRSRYSKDKSNACRQQQQVGKLTETSRDSLLKQKLEILPKFKMLTLSAESKDPMMTMQGLGQNQGNPNQIQIQQSMLQEAGVQQRLQYLMLDSFRQQQISQVVTTRSTEPGESMTWPTSKHETPDLDELSIEDGLRPDIVQGMDNTEELSQGKKGVEIQDDRDAKLLHPEQMAKQMRSNLHWIPYVHYGV
ncbi:hypothetical protein AA313_de0200362 [Arthrobotrys entomopaga]|nr:hypothetical protein AA313_de0200362 [Arthrobotrys entomopaga]